MFNSQQLQEKWAPLLDYDGCDPIKDAHRRAVTATLLENQEKFLSEEQAFNQGHNLTEAPTQSFSAGGGAYYRGSGGTDSGNPTGGFDPVLISLIRRSMPNLVAYDLAGVQPMSGPTGLIFAMRSRYENMTGTEALFDEPDSAFSAQREGYDATQGDYTGGSDSTGAVGFGTTLQRGSNPGVLDPNSAANTYSVGQGMSTLNSETLGESGDEFNKMAFSIEKVTVTAKSRALKAEYSLELAQDLKAIHGLNAEAELANILSTEILAEINREVIRTIYKVAEAGAQTNVATAGQFDLDIDSNGRWSVERFKGLVFQIEREANQIAKSTRRGKGNVMICGSDVASALQMAGVLDYTPALSSNLNVDDTGNTFAGVLNGRTKVYVDPYFPRNVLLVGRRGSSFLESGYVYAPYVPLQTTPTIFGVEDFVPRKGVMTRYAKKMVRPDMYGLVIVRGLLGEAGATS